MTTYFINIDGTDTVSKISNSLYDLGFANCEAAPMPAVVSFAKIETDTKTFGFHFGAQRQGSGVVTLERFKDTFPKISHPKPSYEWLEQQCTALKKQLTDLGYADRGGVMMVPPVGKTPDLTVEQAIQAFKEGKSVTVAGKLMTSGTTVEELLDSHLTLKHKRFGRIVITDQVITAPDAGALVWLSCADGATSNVIYETGRRGALESGVMHYSEQGAIEHAEEMARLNRDGFVEMDVEWLVTLKNAVMTLEHGVSNTAPLSPDYYSDRLGAMLKSIEEKIEAAL